jgi:hypothetical protein
MFYLTRHQNERLVFSIFDYTCAKLQSDFMKNLFSFSQNATLINISFLFTFFLLFSCTDTEREKLIVGEWQGVEWRTEGEPSSYTASDAAFRFDETKRYTYSYGDHTETGDYFITNRQLHTTPEGGTTMMVKIERIEQDTVVFIMNRGGQEEELVLARK